MHAGEGLGELAYSEHQSSPYLYNGTEGASRENGDVVMLLELWIWSVVLAVI